MKKLLLCLSSVLLINSLALAMSKDDIKKEVERIRVSLSLAPYLRDFVEQQMRGVTGDKGFGIRFVKTEKGLAQLKDTLNDILAKGMYKQIKLEGASPEIMQKAQADWKNLLTDIVAGKEVKPAEALAGLKEAEEKAQEQVVEVAAQESALAKELADQKARLKKRKVEAKKAGVPDDAIKAAEKVAEETARNIEIIKDSKEKAEDSVDKAGKALSDAEKPGTSPEDRSKAISKASAETAKVATAIRAATRAETAVKEELVLGDKALELSRLLMRVRTERGLAFAGPKFNSIKNLSDHELIAELKKVTNDGKSGAKPTRDIYAQVVALQAEVLKA